MALPTIPVTNPRFNYRSAALTDITITWRKHGWKPLAEIEAEKPKRHEIRLAVKSREAA